MAVLKIKDQNGNIIPVPSIAGKSAYSYAQDGGYTGTESEFAAKLAAEWATAESVSQLEQEIVDHTGDSDIHVTSTEKETWNNKQDAGNYALKSEVTAEKTARENAIADLNVRIGQQHLLFAEGDTVEDALAWLETNGDASKVYVLPDGFFYEKKETVVETGGVAYTNVLPLAKATDRTTIYNGTGYSAGGNRLSSSGSESTTSVANNAVTGFITNVKVGDVLRLKNFWCPTGVTDYLISYNSSNTKVNYKTWKDADTQGTWLNGVTHNNWYTLASDGVVTVELTETNFGTGFDAIRISGVITAETIITVNEEIKEGGGTAIVETWASTGQAFVPTDYDEAISNLTDITDAHTQAIAELKENAINGTPLTDDEKLNRIREWDAPIYDAHIPVFQLTTEKTAKTNATNTPDTIYAMYDALMAKYPKYITKTDLGVCSDGTNHIYRYDFREPEPYHQSNMPWSETKTKAILVSGIHYEWAGIYSLYYALEEIAENPNLYDLRRNTHFIVIPVINPYCTITSNYNASMGVLNANGVQIHRNFEVGFIYPDESGYVEAGNRNHGGTEPLSEIETQCLDNIFKENTDAAFFLTCHNFDSPSETNGLGFIWASSATKYMCNMGYRLVDKMTKAWLDKHGDALEAGIADYRTDNVSDHFIRLGHAHVSLTDGTETRQATKYGIQGNNVEVCNRFYPHGTTASVEPALSEFTLSRGAETYINFLLTACGTYDYKDKEQYYK